MWHHPTCRNANPGQALSLLVTLWHNANKRGTFTSLRVGVIITYTHVGRTSTFPAQGNGLGWKTSAPELLSTCPLHVCFWLCQQHVRKAHVSTFCFYFLFGVLQSLFWLCFVFYTPFFLLMEFFGTCLHACWHVCQCMCLPA